MDTKDKLAQLHRDIANNPITESQIEQLRSLEDIHHSFLEKEEQTW
jgi:hypothetical protein